MFVIFCELIYCLHRFSANRISCLDSSYLWKEYVFMNTRFKFLYFVSWYNVCPDSGQTLYHVWIHYIFEPVYNVFVYLPTIHMLEKSQSSTLYKLWIFYQMNWKRFRLDVHNLYKVEDCDFWSIWIVGK